MVLFVANVQRSSFAKPIGLVYRNNIHLYIVPIPGSIFNSINSMKHFIANNDEFLYHDGNHCLESTYLKYCNLIG